MAMKLKKIKNHVGIDISDAAELPVNLRVITISYGLYGMNGALFTDTQGNFFKITKRCANLFILI